MKKSNILLTLASLTFGLSSGYGVYELKGLEKTSQKEGLNLPLLRRECEVIREDYDNITYKIKPYSPNRIIPSATTGFCCGGLAGMITYVIFNNPSTRKRN